MDNQKDNTIIDTTILPKLIRDKIANYQIAEAVNESVDEYHEQMMDMIMNLQHNPNGGNIKKLKVCNGYDLHDGKKKYCKKYECTNTSSRMNQDMYICECCKNPKSCYCKEHVQGNLYWAKYDIIHYMVPINKKHHYVATCDDCYQYRLEELGELQKNGGFTPVFILGGTKMTKMKNKIVPLNIFLFPI